AAAMAALAALHNATAGWIEKADRGVSPPAVEERWQRIERWLHQGGIDMMERECVCAEPWLAARAELLIAAFRRWAPGLELDLHAARKRCATLQPCIRDVHDQHVLFRDDQSERPSVSDLID